MRVALVQLGLLGAGLGVLRGVGVIPGLRSIQALAAAGLAYLVGVVATLSICLIVLVAGGSFTLPVFGLIAVILASPLLLDLRPARHSEISGDHAPDGQPSVRWAVIVVIVTLGALAVLAVIGLLTLGNRPIGTHNTDAWHIWASKARLLFYSPHLPASIFGFGGDFRNQPHYNFNPSYPLLLPLLEALHMRALGNAEPGSIHVVLWLLAIAFVWAGGFLASRVTPAIVWVPLLAGAALLSMDRLLTGYADVPLGYYLGLGTLALGIWLRSGQRRDLVVATLLLAGAAAIKNEGTVGALVVMVAALAETLYTRRRPAARELAVAFALLVIVAILPWRLWVSAHHLQTEQPLGRIIDPVFLADHVSRVGSALAALAGHLANPSGVTLFVSLALAMVAVCFWERRDRGLAAFYLVAGFGYFVALVWSYWVTDIGVASQIHHSSPRVVAGPAFIALAAVLQLSELPGGRAEGETGRARLEAVETI